MRIFKAVITVLLVIIFLGLLVSAYTHYQANISVAGLVDASSSIANHLVSQELVYEESGSPREYVIDTSKLSDLSSTQEIAGDNFRLQLYLKYGPRSETILGPYGSVPPDDRAVASLTIPVVVSENYRSEVGKLEVKVWRD